MHFLHDSNDQALAEEPFPGLIKFAILVDNPLVITCLIYVQK